MLIYGKWRSREYDDLMKTPQPVPNYQKSQMKPRLKGIEQKKWIMRITNPWIFILRFFFRCIPLSFAAMHEPILITETGLSRNVWSLNRIVRYTQCIHNWRVWCMDDLILKNQINRVVKTQEKVWLFDKTLKAKFCYPYRKTSQGFDV